MSASSSPTAPAAYVPHKAIAPLFVGALGVVFGDIGTSPLYAMKMAFSPEYGIPLSRTSVLGLLSLIVWSMAWVVAMKYLIVMMRADNNGEGGILALLALALREVKKTEPRLRWGVISVGIFGAAMFYGDSMITPAISVLSAVEGLEIATPAFSKYVIPITLGILTGLFVIQRHGTARIGVLFGPVTVLWFLAIAASGASHVVDNPDVLAALNPARRDLHRALSRAGLLRAGRGVPRVDWWRGGCTRT